MKENENYNEIWEKVYGFPPVQVDPTMKDHGDDPPPFPQTLPRRRVNLLFHKPIPIILHKITLLRLHTNHLLPLHLELRLEYPILDIIIF